MPELPEVETTCRGIAPHLEGHVITDIIVRQPQLRWPVPETMRDMIGLRVKSVSRRAKYVLLSLENGTALLHLGMSGSLRVVGAELPPQKHDHIDWVLDSGKAIRLHDPRRFGAALWTTEAVNEHPLIAHLGPEPLTDDFDTDTLFKRSRNRRVAIKTFIMDAKVVVGVGNIYASEALFMAGISPLSAAGKVSRKRYGVLVDCIKQVLQRSIDQGGTTLRDFVQAEGKPGYFKQQLNVYDRAGEPCRQCSKVIKQLRQGQRSTFYCPNCQT